MKQGKAKKTKLTPMMSKALEAVNSEGLLTLSAIQRLLKCSFHKAIEIALLLSDQDLVKTNVQNLKIEKR